MLQAIQQTGVNHWSCPGPYYLECEVRRPIDQFHKTTLQELVLYKMNQHTRLSVCRCSFVTAGLNITPVEGFLQISLFRRLKADYETAAAAADFAKPPGVLSIKHM